jgi:hypothetical protein
MLQCVTEDATRGPQSQGPDLALLSARSKEAFASGFPTWQVHEIKDNFWGIFTKGS